MAGKEAPKDPKALPGSGTAPEPVKKGSRVKKIAIIIIILLIILSAGGAGAYWWFFLRVPGSGEEATPPPVENTAPPKGTAPAKSEGGPRIERQSDLPRSTGKVLPLPEFVVNLSDPSGKRYLKLGMEVEVNSDVAQALKANSAKIRDAVIILLAGKSFADVSSAEGKVLLKAEVASRLNQILGGAYVVRVYFTEFVVQ